MENAFRAIILGVQQDGRGDERRLRTEDYLHIPIALNVIYYLSKLLPNSYAGKVVQCTLLAVQTGVLFPATFHLRHHPSKMLKFALGCASFLTLTELAERVGASPFYLSVTRRSIWAARGIVVGCRVYDDYDREGLIHPIGTFLAVLDLVRVFGFGAEGGWSAPMIAAGYNTTLGVVL